MTEPTTVSEREFIRVLSYLRTVRAWATKSGIDPWTFRQALLLVLELDTSAALERGITGKTLATFDSRSREDARRFLKEAGA